jgi:hypothetical protein
MSAQIGATVWFRMSYAVADSDTVQALTAKRMAAAQGNVIKLSQPRTQNTEPPSRQTPPTFGPRHAVVLQRTAPQTDRLL